MTDPKKKEAVVRIATLLMDCFDTNGELSVNTREEWRIRFGVWAYGIPSEKIADLEDVLILLQHMTRVT